MYKCFRIVNQICSDCFYLKNWVFLPRAQVWPLPPLWLSAGSHVSWPEPCRLLQHVHRAREEEGPAPPGVGQEEPARHGLLRPDGVPEEDPVPVWTNIQVALHPALHAVQQHPSCGCGPGQHHGWCCCSFWQGESIRAKYESISTLMECLSSLETVN